METPTAIGRTTVQKAAGYYRTELPHAGDLEMWLRFAARASVACINAHQAYYRTHGSNMSAGYGGAKDLRQVNDAFDMFFRHDQKMLSCHIELCRVTKRALLQQAFDGAYHALERGDRQAYRAYEKVAHEIGWRTWLSPRWLRLNAMALLGPRTWSRLQALRRLGPG